MNERNSSWKIFVVLVMLWVSTWVEGKVREPDTVRAGDDDMDWPNDDGEMEELHDDHADLEHFDGGDADPDANERQEEQEDSSE